MLASGRAGGCTSGAKARGRQRVCALAVATSLQPPDLRRCRHNIKQISGTAAVYMRLRRP